MDKNLIERYKEEMMRMYRGKSVSVNASISQENAPPSKPSQIDISNADSATEGALIGLVTTIRSLYPVENAKVTVFTGTPDNMETVAVAFTDQSGRTEVFNLPTPEKSLSLDSENEVRPYSLYNMMVEADGYLTNIHLNIPVFSGVTSLQRSNMILTETSGVDKGPQIFDEGQNYNL